MGARKRNSASKRKEEKLKTYQATLRNCPTSPRKMRLVADMVKGMEVNRALDVLKFSSKEASRKVEKLLMSAISNWQVKNEGVRIEESNLFIREAFVDQGKTLRRLSTAPQGRAYRIRKRSNHITLILDSAIKEVENSSN
ncbi:MAG: 50S ribosomal protein L22 [Bacteroidia bacterium]|nr:MAG: 50S ribosomal protein L22 [Bacteroidia bacterium]